MMTRISTAFLALLFAFTLAACEPEGPAEQAGEALDESVEETQQAVEDGAEKAADAFDNKKENQ